MKKAKKKHKLILIAPSGEEYKLGFLSPCRDGIVLGASKLNDVETSHLTIVVKSKTLSSHITPQNKIGNRQFFPSLNLKDISDKFHKIIENKMITPLSSEEMSQDVIYFTKKFRNWLNLIEKILYQEKESPKEIIHILNVKNLIEKAPDLINKITNSPSSYFGSCKAYELPRNESKIVGFTDSNNMVIPIENQLYSINLPLLTDFAFKPTINEPNFSTPLNEIYQSMGIPQYIKNEIIEKKFLKNIFSKENLKL